MKKQLKQMMEPQKSLLILPTEMQFYLMQYLLPEDLCMYHYHSLFLFTSRSQVITILQIIEYNFSG